MSRKDMPQHYRLANGTIEIDGVRMHQTSLKTPQQDAADKVAALKVRAGERVLDVCTGLGLSSIAFAQKGARVTTVEKDENVLALAKENPASIKLFDNPRITQIVGNAFDVLPLLDAESFDVVCHDPPRLSMAGELYGLAFYRQLFRVLGAGGRLFHYTGNPGKKSGKNIARGVKARLLEAGFSGIRWHEDLQGFTAFKR